MIRAAIFATLVLIANCALAAPPITALAFSPDGKQVIAASQDGLAIYDWSTLERQNSIRSKLGQTHDLLFSSDGRSLLAVGGWPAESGNMRLMPWPIQDDKASQRRSMSEDLIFQASWIDDQRIVVSGCDGRLQIVDRDGQVLQRLKGHSRHVLCVVSIDGGKTLVSGGADASVRVWDVESGKLLRTLGNHTAAVRDLAVRPHHEGPPMVASAGADKTVRLWQPTIGRLIRFARLDSAPLAIDWTPGGDLLLAACEDGRLRVIDATSVRIVQEHAAIDGWAYAVAASPDGRHAVVAGENGQLKRIPIDALTSRPR